jgi:DNA polymerase-3 subunit alpha
LLLNEKNGAFKSIENFITRVPSGLESIQTLIFIEPLVALAKQKVLIIEARMLLIHHKLEVNTFAY